MNQEKNSTTVQTEVLAGISSFPATSYIIVVNPRILSQAGLPFSGVPIGLPSKFVIQEEPI